MSGTISSPSNLMTTEIVDNTTGLITPVRVRDIVESACAIVLSPNGVKTASYTAQFTDRGCIVPFNVASGSGNYTIPPHSSVSFANSNMLGLFWVSGAAIQPAFVAGAAVTINTPSSLTLRVPGSIAWAFQYSQDVWYLLGDLT